MKSSLNNIEACPPDSIFHLNSTFIADTSPSKVFLGIGAYRDDNGKPWILPSVQKAEAIIFADPLKYNKEYPP